MSESARTAVQSRNTEIDSLGVQNKSLRRVSMIAGGGLLLLVGLAAFGNFAVLEDLITQGDATQTANDVMNAEGLFRFGIVSLFLVAVLDVVVAWALFRVFEPVSRSLSLLAAWFRALYAGVFLVAISQLVGVLQMLNDADYLAVFGAEQLHAQALLGINTFYDIWDVGYILFGVHLLLLGYLAYQSEYAPKLLGVLLAIAGLGYAIDSVGPVLSAGYTIELTLFTFAGEVVLLLWLLIRGRHIVLQNESDSPAG